MFKYKKTLIIYLHSICSCTQKLDLYCFAWFNVCSLSHQKKKKKNGLCNGYSTYMNFQQYTINRVTIIYV